MYMYECLYKRVLKHKTEKHSPIYQWLVIVDILKALVMLPMSIVSGYYGKWLFDQLGKKNFSNLGDIPMLPEVRTSPPPKKGSNL